MLYSMTGYGKYQTHQSPFSISIEIRALNSKSIEINLKMPYWLMPIEFEIRALIQKILIRGKIDVFIELQVIEGIYLKTYHLDVIKEHFTQLQQIAKYLNISESNDYLIAQMFREAINIPNAYENKENELLSDTHKTWILECIQSTCEKVNLFRKIEGQKLQEDILNQIQSIQELKQKILAIDPQRKSKIKEKILNTLKDNLDISKINYERFEQEMIYYLEKLDINEELIRLSSHLEYFQQVCTQEYTAGKKLSFIAQEIGREINTIGSKANDDTIQKLVVEMKDKLEKIKEQINNIL